MECVYKISENARDLAIKEVGKVDKSKMKELLDSNQVNQKNLEELANKVAMLFKEFENMKEKNRSETIKQKKIEIEKIREGTRKTTDKSFSLLKQ